MNILFHVAVGNTDRPARWFGVCSMFSRLARSFSILGDHNCLIYCHPRAVSQDIYKNHLISDTVNKIDGFNPDVIFTWNGMSPGDQQIIKLYGREKFIFGELGFFDHYDTCYFDRSGTNATSMNIVETLDDIQHFPAEKKFAQLVDKYKKERLIDYRYVFVPLQDETDTQITKLSPFKTMYELLEYVITLYNFDDDIKILYKQHPHKPTSVPKNKKLVEVKGNVHHYLPYAENVIGINSTVMFETLLYHQRVLTIGLGLPSRRFTNDIERHKFIVNCYNKQLYQKDLSDVDIVKKSWVYKQIKTWSS